MNRDIAAKATNARVIADLSAAPNAIMRRLLAHMARLNVGSLVLELPSGQQLCSRASVRGPEAVMKVRRWRALRRLVARGDIGFAEGYLDGDWTTPDLKQVFAWAHANESALTPALKGASLHRFINRVIHGWRANTRRGSRRNIAAHYDLGNDFYGAWLDDTMSYSSAIFDHPGQSLREAQLNKIQRIIDLLDISEGTSVLEIGCGWGALAERLVGRGATLTGITLSNEQLAVALERVKHADPSGQSGIVYRDYRDVEGCFDRIVSIEMFEAAGEAYWPAYFDKLRSCLKPGGIALLQVITISEDRFDDYRRRPDFIQRYIFPGGMLPTVSRMHRLIDDAGLVLDGRQHFGDCYARTLAVWRERFLSAFPTLTGAVACERFRNMWEYYLAYCEVGFENGAIDVGLYRIRRPAEGADFGPWQSRG